ncbi:cell adhesion molecule CEACAM4 [Dasypus novemcinctus]|uniref:cell adhesion molecule CEACAM4 n=1 Tax=Dasypus novemcinctus TaxID=9361 RepID=UPI0039C9D9FD
MGGSGTRLDGGHRVVMEAQLLILYPSPGSCPKRAVDGTSGGVPSPYLSAGAIAGIVTGVLAGLALTAVLGWFLLCMDSAGARSQQDLREPRPPACPPGHRCLHNPASQVPLHDSRAAVPIYEVSWVMPRTSPPPPGCGEQFRKQQQWGNRDGDPGGRGLRAESSEKPQLGPEPGRSSTWF